MLPPAVLRALRTSFARQAGAEAAVQALQEAGYETGAGVLEDFSRTVDGPVGELDEATFWSRLSDFLRYRGWGTLRHSRPHPAIGLLSSEDWAESGGDTGDTGDAGDAAPSGSVCTFSSGMLASLLSGAAGGGDAVSVLHVRCRGRGDEECTFAFGAVGTIGNLYDRLREDDDLDRALSLVS